MSQADLNIENQPGLNFRAEVNASLQALATCSSGSTAPTTTYAYQLWVDTSGANPILKQRNGANNAWVTIGRVDIANFGLLPLTGGTLSAAILFSNTDYTTVPVGTDGQRPGSPTAGMIRFNSTQTAFEGYNGTAWAPIGGGGYVVTAVETIAGGGTVETSTSDVRQLRYIQGNAGPVALSSTPFGSGGGWKDGTEVTLICVDSTNTVSLTANDSAKGAVGNFSTIEMIRFRPYTFIYSSTYDRWILVQGGY